MCLPFCMSPTHYLVNFGHASMRTCTKYHRLSKATCIVAHNSCESSCIYTLIHSHCIQIDILKSPAVKLHNFSGSKMDKKVINSSTKYLISVRIVPPHYSYQTNTIGECLVVTRFAETSPWLLKIPVVLWIALLKIFRCVVGVHFVSNCVQINQIYVLKIRLLKIILGVWWCAFACLKRQGPRNM